MIKLNLGAGDNHLPVEEGWVNTDLRDGLEYAVEQRWDFRKEIPLPDESVDFILAWHILEHAGLTERDTMIKDWYRVLKPGGKLAVAVPDLLKRLAMYQQGIIGENPWFQLMVSIYGPWHGFEGDYHRWGYNYEELERILREGGFGRVSPLNEATVPVEIKKYTIGEGPLRKVVLADWAAQCLAIK